MCASHIHSLLLRRLLFRTFNISIKHASRPHWRPGTSPRPHLDCSFAKCVRNQSQISNRESKWTTWIIKKPNKKEAHGRSCGSSLGRVNYFLEPWWERLLTKSLSASMLLWNRRSLKYIKTTVSFGALLSGIDFQWRPLQLPEGENEKKSSTHNKIKKDTTWKKDLNTVYLWLQAYKRRNEEEK